MGVALTLVALGCSGPQSTPAADNRGPAGIVALLLPDKQAARYEAQDAPIFETELSKVCPNATVDEQNAEGSGPTQQLQVEEEIAKGARVLVLDPQDGSALGSVVSDATTRSVKVISYDRLLDAPGSKPDAYVAYDAEQAVGIDPAGRPLTGSGGELEVIQRIVAGSQSVTVYEPVRPEATEAADLACAALAGGLAPTHTTTSNGTGAIPSYLLTPIAVSRDGRLPGTVSIEDSVVKDQLFGADTVAQICTAALASNCAAAGIK